MNKSTLLATLSITATLLAFTAQAETKNLTLMLDWFVNPNHGPVVIAKERGYFK